MWSRSWQVAKFNLSQSKRGYIFSILFIAYFCFFIGMTMSRVLGEPVADRDWSDYVMPDIMMLTCMSVMGFSMSKEYQRYWSQNTFTRKLVFMRALPIRVEELVLGRYQALFAGTIALSPVLYVPLYFFGGFGEYMSLLHYVAWAVTWIAIGSIMSGLYIWAEMGWSGKQYFWFSLLAMVLILLLGTAGRVFGFSLVMGTLDLVDRYGWLVPLVGAALSLLLTRVWMKITERRIRTRDYAR